MAAKLRAHRIDSRQEQDAIAMLIADHKKVKALFAEFHTLKDDGSGEDKSAIVEQVCNALKIHAAIEEEIFYPAVRKAIDVTLPHIHIHQGVYNLMMPGGEYGSQKGRGTEPSVHE
jgi:Hemerythrin HHE cation binding domain